MSLVLYIRGGSMTYIKKYGLIVIIILLMIVSYFLTPKDNQMDESLVITPVETVQLEEYVYVDVKGSVVQPGVYKLKTGSRLFQVIEYAGGFLDEANTVNVNLSLLLTDQMVVYIPSVYDVEMDDSTNDVIGENVTSTLVNINTADQSTLETLPGIGPATAFSIIEYRLTNGNFDSIEDIMNVSGIGTQTYENIKVLITV